MMSSLLRRFNPKPGQTGAAGDRELSIAPGVEVSVHADGATLLQISTGKIFVCNRTGSRMWLGLASGLQHDEICNEIARECGISSQTVERDFQIFVAELQRSGLLVAKGQKR